MEGRMLKKIWGIIRLFVLISLMTIAYIYAIHEPAHYIVCITQLKSCRIVVFPVSVQHEENPYISAAGLLSFFMAPYVVDILVIAAFGRTKNRYLRLIPYVAFFDVISSFFTLSITNFFLGFSSGDPYVMIHMFERLHPSFVGPAILLVILIFALTVYLFYKLYGQDLNKDRDNGFFRTAFLLFISIEILNIFCYVILRYLIIR